MKKRKRIAIKFVARFEEYIAITKQRANTWRDGDKLYTENNNLFNASNHSVDVVLMIVVIYLENRRVGRVRSFQGNSSSTFRM